ncbi:MAG: C_GCAxxG_C_C family protein [Clostridia bacterium]|nr:C_GCAxxG_C_C family protein [Clostridia bacterium]
MCDHAERARELFEAGYNCSQAVFGAFTDLTGYDLDSAMRLSSSFGGGMGRMREVCGAVSGMFMVLGVLYGYSDPCAKEEKTEHYKNVQRLAEEFKEIYGSVICRELLGSKQGGLGHVPADRTPEYYNARPCTRICMDCAEILDRFIKENPIKR